MKLLTYQTYQGSEDDDIDREETLTSVFGNFEERVDRLFGVGRHHDME